MFIINNAKRLCGGTKPFMRPNPFFKQNGAVLLRFQKELRPHLSFPYRFRPSTLNRRIRFENAYTLSAHAQMHSTHAHFNISAREIGAKLKPHGNVCPPFWILTVEWSGARSCLFWCRHHVFSVHTRKQRFQKASFSNCFTLESVFEWLRFRWSFSALSQEKTTDSHFGIF